MKYKAFNTLLISLFSASLANANQPLNDSANEIIFTASQFSEPSETIGASVDVITDETIKDAQYVNILEAFNTIPGVNITQTSVNGVGNIFIRGMGSDSSLILIDGIVLNDPSSPGRGVDFGTLNLLNIDRIEILKGPQSTLYGSSAMAGVIQITTNQGNKKPTSISIERGSDNYLRTNLITQGMTDKWQYSFGLNHMKERGISAADVKLGNHEKDGFRNNNASFHVNYAPIDQLNFDVILRYENIKADYDAYNGDDLYLYQKTRRILGRFALNTFLFDNQLETSLSYDINDSSRRTFNDPDEFNSTYERSWYKGKVSELSLRNILTLNPNFKTLFGISKSQETASSYYYSRSEFLGQNYEVSAPFPKKQITLNGLYLDQHFDFSNKWFNTIGFRYDHHSEYGDNATYRLTSRYNLNSYINFKGSFGSGFKAPTLYQLYDPTYGNIGLYAEKSKGFDTGIIITPNEKNKIEINYFQQSYTNKIDFDLVDNRFINQGKVKTSGIEFSLHSNIHKMLNLGINYTYLDAKNQENEKRLIQRPRHTGALSLNYKPNERINSHLEAQYHGTFLDNENGSIQKQKAYWLLNIAGSYKINEHFELNARINNLLDKHYYTVYGYGQKRINAYVGMKVSF